jgi:hypothetical protein
MDLPRSKPAYHHPIPWQVVVALVLIGASILSLTYLVSLLWIEYDSGDAPLWPLVATAVGIVVQVTVGVCIAARLNWARVAGFTLCILAALVAVVSGFAAGVNVSSFTGVGVGIVLFFLLRSDKAAAYTYKGGGGWPED